MAEKRSKEAFKEQARKKAYEYELQFHGCSQAVVRTFQDLLDPGFVQRCAQVAGKTAELVAEIIDE